MLWIERTKISQVFVTRAETKKRVCLLTNFFPLLVGINQDFSGRVFLEEGGEKWKGGKKKRQEREHGNKHTYIYMCVYIYADTCTWSTSTKEPLICD